LVSAQTGCMSELFKDIRYRDSRYGPKLIGSGCDINYERARDKAIMETLERYAIAAIAAEELVTATHQELGNKAISPYEIPQISQYISAENEWRQINFEANKKIRWVPAISVSRETEIYLPLVMVHAFLDELPGEHFYPQTTAGSAAHFSLEAATFNALCEVIERDAVELIWALRPPLQQLLVGSHAPPDLRQLHDHDQIKYVNQRYFDATNEFNVPIVYAVREITTPIGEDLIVACACSDSIYKAALKARLDCSGQQIMRINESQGHPYTRYKGGNGYLVSDSLDMAPNLSFLNFTKGEKNSSSRIMSEVSDFFNEKCIVKKLNNLLSKFEQLGHEVYLVNLTTNEMKQAGVFVVKAIVPSLLTLSPTPFQRFITHPRITDRSQAYNNGTFMSNFDVQPFC